MATDASARVTASQRAKLLHGIYAILNEAPRVLDLARASLAGGVRVLQYRAKGGIVPEHLHALRELTRRSDALLILNDDWRAVDAYDCDGVHLGPGDDGFGAVAEIRRALAGRLIGLSCATAAEVREANASNVDYVGSGSVFATRSKADAGEPIGVARLQALVAVAAVPVAAVGGITAPRIAQIRAAGAAMAAVIGAIADAARPEGAARELVEAWNRTPA
jgi:thiamine-phosphate pyrophosphorylase